MHIIRLVIFFIKLWKIFLNAVFTLIKFSIEFGLNPALAVVCLFIYILFVCLFTYFISIISLSLKLEQITPPHWLCHAHFKVSNILYWIVEDVFKCHFHIKKNFNSGSSLIIVNEQIKFVSFSKEWEDTRHCIFLWQYLNRTCPHSVLGWGLVLWILILRNVLQAVPVPPGLSGLLVKKQVIVSN